jgi:NADPH2:quinone reductase
VFPLPDHASYTDGAAFLMTFLTAYIPLTRQVRAGPGDTVLVHAAAGGVGTAALQIARWLGAETLATAGSGHKLELARSLGARAAFDYTGGDLVADVRAETGGRGVDVVVDPVGGELLGTSLGLLAPLGIAVAVGYAGGAWPPVDPALLVGRNIGLVGIFLGRLMKLEPETVRVAATELLGHWSAGAFAPVVGATLPLDEADRALDLLASRQTTGKLVLGVA